MKKKNASADQRWRLLTKRPMPETCHQDGPKITSTTPEPTTTISEAMVRTPKT